MDTPTGQIPIVQPQLDDVTEDLVDQPARVEASRVRRDTIPDLEGSDPEVPGAELSDETDMPDLVPLHQMKIKMPSEQIQERTRSVLATIVVLIVLGSQVAYAFMQVKIDGIYLILSTGTAALTLVLGYYFYRPHTKRRPKGKR